MKKTISLLLVLTLLFCSMSVLSSCGIILRETQGEHGAHGTQGEKGDTGAIGAQGPQGEDGRGILKVEIIDGYLWITYTDDPNTPVNVGSVLYEDSASNCFLFQINLDGESCSVVGLQNCMDTELVIPSKYMNKPVTRIYSAAFNDCNFIKSITIPDSVKAIDANSFQYCVSLTSIIIPNSVRNISTYAFYGCKSLTSITFEGTVAQWNAISFGYSWNYNVPATEVVCSDGTVTLS